MAAAIVALLTAGCGAQPPSSSAGAVAEPPDPDRASHADGREPVGDAEAILAELQRYGSKHPDEFGGLYIDPPGSDSFVVLFTDRLDQHAAAVAEISPRVSVRAAEYTEAQLNAILEHFDPTTLEASGVQPLGIGMDTPSNRVVLEVLSNDPTLELRLEAQYGGPVDVRVHRPPPGEWSNAAEGDGWRLLAAGEAGSDEAYRVRAARNEAEWDALWSTLALDEERPLVDLDREVVASFGHGVGSGCREVRLDEVVIGGGVVFSVTSDPLAPRQCTADLTGAAVFVVAIERATLPADVFKLQLNARLTNPDGGLGEVIDVLLP